jgi:flagellar biosynthesis protein FlhA
MMLIFPLPPIMLDILFTLNIALSVLILLSGIQSLTPLDFSVFPTVLLLATLMRLALNVASTRVVLLFGYQGPGAAGEVIRAFGEIVVGGNTVVGFVVFFIFIIINFMVITKGATRISEVSARFTLDSMPGKQMAIDSELNSGIISADVAQTRRLTVTQEADFYGAMDGASKFIRGDAVAGLLIVFINWIGGTCIGFFQHNMPFLASIKTYALLTIGDGLVTQIPALILSTAAAIMVTRVSTRENMAQQIKNQVFGNQNALFYGGMILFGLGLLPGMPHTSFLIFAVIMSGMAVLSGYRPFKVRERDNSQLCLNRDTALTWESILMVPALSIELGTELMALYQKNPQGLEKPLDSIRQQCSLDYGFLFPTSMIKENSMLKPNEYCLKVYEIKLSGGVALGDRYLAIKQNQISAMIAGIPTQDPIFHCPAIWIDKQEKERAESLGYTVIDVYTLIATHVKKLIKENAYRLLDQEAVRKSLSIVAVHSPSLVEALVPKCISIATLTQVLRQLLQEQVSIRDLKSILESFAQQADKSQDVGVLTQLARVALGSWIIQQKMPLSDEMYVVTLCPALENLLQQSIKVSHPAQMVLEPKLAAQLKDAVMAIVNQYQTDSDTLIILVGQGIRRALFQFISTFWKDCTVMAYEEMPAERPIKVLATIGA